MPPFQMEQSNTSKFGLFAGSFEVPFKFGPCHQHDFMFVFHISNYSQVMLHLTITEYHFKEYNYVFHILMISACYLQCWNYWQMLNFYNLNTQINSWEFIYTPLSTANVLRCASGCVVECWICNREVAGSNLSLGYFAPKSTQPSIPPESVNEYQL